MGERPAGVPGGIGLTVAEYAEFLAKEYLGGYLRDGGAAVRFVVAGDIGVAGRWHRRLAELAADDGYLYVPVDAADVRVHQLQDVFGVVARAVDWPQRAAHVVRVAYDELALRVGDSLAAVDVARANEVDVRELARDLRLALERAVLTDLALAPDFRRAMLRLCQAELAGDRATSADRADVLAWLTAEPQRVPLPRLRALLIGGRVDRSTARALLLSVPPWLARTGSAGLVLDLDLSRLAVTRRPPAAERQGVYYSRAAVLDAYEVLRQLVDAVDGLRSCLVAVTLPPELVADEARGLPAYTALHLRIADEVRDRRRANPYAALVRLESRLEVTT